MVGHIPCFFVAASHGEVYFVVRSIVLHNDFSVRPFAVRAQLRSASASKLASSPALKVGPAIRHRHRDSSAPSPCAPLATRPPACSLSHSFLSARPPARSIASHARLMFVLSLLAQQNRIGKFCDVCRQLKKRVGGGNYNNIFAA